MSAHTPGPWTIQELMKEHRGYADWPTFCIRSQENVCLAVVGEVDHYQSEKNPANARLIAAAPRMLDLIRRALKNDLLYATSLEDDARAILRDVEGESNG